MAAVYVKGLDNVLKRLAALDALKDIDKGVVFHEGAISPRGRRYEHYVQGEGQQAHIHEGRWQTEADVAKEKEQEIVRLFEEWLDILLSGRQTTSTQVLNNALELLKQRLQEYPPPPAGSRYVRTGALRDGWSTELR